MRTSQPSFGSKVKKSKKCCSPFIWLWPDASISRLHSLSILHRALVLRHDLFDGHQDGVWTFDSFESVK